MAITAHKLRRCEVWSTWAAAGGVRQAVVDDPTGLVATSTIAGDGDSLDISLPLVSPAAPYVVPGAVIRIEEADAVFDEWLITVGPNDDDGSGLRTARAFPIRAAMAKCELVRRIDSDGTSLLDFESVGLTPAQHIAAWVVPALTRGGMAWVVAGTITPTKLLDLTFASDSPLSVLQRLAEQTEMELDIRRTGGGYAIDLIAEIGSAQPTADLRFDKNLQPGTKRNRSSLESATRVYPLGADEDGRRATMSRATWQVSNIVGLVVTLVDPAGGAGPIQFDGQLSGANGTTQAYLRKPGATLTAITASSASAQTVTVTSAASLAIGDLVQFRADSAGSDMLWLDSPPDRLLYGLTVGKVEMSDVPSTNNLLKNAVMRNWPGAPTSPPTNWTAVGGGTVARQSASPFTRVGGFSIHRVGVSAGDGVVSDAAPIFPTALKPYISGYAGLWVVSGQVRVELVFTTAGGPVVLPLPPDFATNSVLGQWVDLGLSGIDANALAATAVAIRVVQHGATAADFYLDYGQVTESSDQLPLAESSGGTRLWQAANEALRTGGAPLVSYEVKIVDLANLDPVTWGADCKVVVGGKVRVTDPRLSIAITTRLIEMVRDYKVPGDTAIKLSNKFDDMTGQVVTGMSPPRGPVDVSEGPGVAFAEAIAKITATSATQVTVTVTANPASPAQQVQYVGVTGGATLASGTAAGTWVTPNGTNNVWVFNRAALNAGVGQAQFRAGNVTGFQNDDDLVTIEEQGRDTVALASRARVTATTPTTLTVRVAVADPFPQGAASATIGYSELGLGGATTPATGQTVTPAATLTEAAGTFVDYTVTRPAFGLGAGRITFTATAANRTSDSDAVDVPEVDRDTVSLNARARVTATTPTTLTVRVAVADPFPQGANTATIDYNVLGLGGATTPAAGQTVTPASTLTEAAGTFVDYTVTRPAFGAGSGRITFHVTAANRQSSVDAVDVPEVDRDTQSISVRVLRISETADQVVVRVEAITPNTGATVTVNYDAGGLSISPATGGTFSATTSFGTTGHIDYTITRDAQGGSPRRVAFTVSASGNIDGTDGVDVPPNSTRFRCNLVVTGSPTQATGTTPTQFTAWTEAAPGWDIGGLHDDATNPSRITIPVGGNQGAWIIQAGMAYGANTTGDRYIELRKNGGTVRVVCIPSTKTSNNTVIPIFFVDNAPSVGDYYEVYIWQNSGVTLGVGGGTAEGFFAAIHIW